MITPEEEEKIFTGIWAGVITVFSLPVILYQDTFEGLETRLFRGFGGNLTDFEEGSREFIQLTKLRENLNFFSAAKTFQNVKDTQVFRLDEGQLRPFPEFRQDAKKIFDTYNDDWLKAEFETTVSMAQSADQWIDIQRDEKTLPLLKYVTAGDDRVRPEHAAWDGIVKPVNDPFWDSHNPPNGYRCRCVTIQLEEGEEDTTNLGKHLEKVKRETDGKITTLANDDSLFAINPGKVPFIFKDKGTSPHPYFKVGRQFNELKKQNFGLPTL